MCSDSGVWSAPLPRPSACVAGACQGEAVPSERCDPAAGSCSGSAPDAGAPLDAGGPSESAEPTSPMDPTVMEPVDPVDPAVLSGPDYSFFRRSSTIVEGLGPIGMTAPAEWADVDTSAWVTAEGVTLGPRLVASTDAARFARDFDIPGVLIAATTFPPLGVAARVAELELETRCTRGESTAYEDALCVGIAESWSDCGTTAARTTVVAVNDKPAGASSPSSWSP